MAERTDQLELVRPEEIEKRSFQIIRGELKERGISLDEDLAPVILRCIHTSADFDYAENLCFSEGAVELGRQALLEGCSIVTDTRMAQAGISRKSLERLGGRTFCFMSDPDVAEAARREGVTRAIASMEKAARMGQAAGERGELSGWLHPRGTSAEGDRDLQGGLVYAIGNAPTALIRLADQMERGEIRPRLLIGVPVGFVNVVAAKEMAMAAAEKAQVPYIIARGRKGGSNIAACIVNALLYGLTRA